MEIIRVLKGQNGATVARLALSKTSTGRIQAVIKVEGPMSAVMERGEYETVKQAESAAVAIAEQRSASVLLIEDRT